MAGESVAFFYSRWMIEARLTGRTRLGYPTIKWLGADHKQYLYGGERNLKELTAFVKVRGRLRAVA